VLRHLNLADLSVPTDELRAYLLARYGDRFDVHPRKYEEIVGGVFSDFGFRVRVTSFSGDEGIDILVLDGDDDATVGVQVKRYKGKISAEQIRSFVGALVLQGLTTGIYVTTSSYEKGAHRTVAAAEQLGVGVTLLDAMTFYEALKITTRSTHWDVQDPSAAYYGCWQDINAYLSDSPVGSGAGRKWLDTAGYVWGSSW
jgi:restriction system protein